MNNFDADTLLRAFPFELSKTTRMAMIASIVAEELQSLSDDHDLLAIFARIDELDDAMLNILAKDFKIDWWDADADLEKKREMFKSTFTVHRTLGTIGSVKRALTDMYSSATIKEWPEYEGVPYHYKLEIDLGAEFGTHEIVQRILYRARFYTNVRSVLEKISFSTSRTRKLYYGLAIQYGLLAVYHVAGLDMTLLNVLTDEDGVLLTDENGELLMEY